jgi:hypothetical protein
VTVTEATVTKRSALHQPQMSRLHSHPKRHLHSAAVIVEVDNPMQQSAVVTSDVQAVRLRSAHSVEHQLVTAAAALSNTTMST